MTEWMRLSVFCALLLLFVTAVATTLARAEQPIIIQRVIEVPPGATLTYAVDGKTVQSMSLPVGTASITLRFEPLDFRGKIVNRHGRIIRRTP
jgi:hypothetical protein